MIAPAWEGRRVLVTGATGLVGSWLCKALLERGARVTAFVRDPDPLSELTLSGADRRVRIAMGKLESHADVERAVNEHEIEAVFHLGAQALVGAAMRSPLPTFEANVRGTWNLLEACRVHADRVRTVVVASSDKAYGDSEQLPYTEAHRLEGRNPYDVSKSCTDLIATAFHHSYALPVVIARCGNIYGGGDLHWSRIVPGTIRSILRGERPVVRSDGTLVRDYFYVEDAVAAYLALAERIAQPGVAGTAFNFSNEDKASVLDIVQTICKAMGAENLAPEILGGATGEIRAQWLAAARARKELEWRPAFDLRDGLERTIAWYREFLGSHPQA
ncbi:MAG TPA: NAD-dependent epimerase/dehydratase family protein [Planctomycetota bacterium]